MDISQHQVWALQKDLPLLSNLEASTQRTLHWAFYACVRREFSTKGKITGGSKSPTVLSWISIVSHSTAYFTNFVSVLANTKESDEAPCIKLSHSWKTIVLRIWKRFTNRRFAPSRDASHDRGHNNRAFPSGKFNFFLM